MKVSIKNDYLVTEFDFDENTIAQVKSIGMRWSKPRKVWYGKITKLFISSFLKLFPEFQNELKNYTPVNIDYSKYVPSDYLMDHQRKSALTATIEPRRALFHDVGTGKSVTGIEFIKQKQVKTLVLTKLGIIRDAWIHDLKQFAPEINAINLWALKQKNSPAARKLFSQSLEECEVAIINFESFRSLQPELEQAGFQMLLIDESAKVKDNRSKITEAIIKFSDNMDFVYPLSGNPAPNTEMEYWSQLRVVDPLLFGANFYAFRAKYFYSYGYGGFKWEMKENKRDEFLEKLASVSEVVRKEDVLDLPEKTENVRRVYLDAKERKAYEDMKKHLVIEFGDKEVIAANAAVKLMKLREGTSGFYLDDEKNVVKVGNSKFNELKELLEEIGDNQVIIWTHFHYEGDQIEKMLEDKSYCRIDGTIKNQNVKDASLEAFKNGNVQYLISHPASLGHGVTMVNCTYAVYFSLSHSWELYDQSSGRIYRKGQTSKCTYYFLIADNSVDEVIMDALMKKGKVAEAVFDYIKGRV